MIDSIADESTNIHCAYIYIYIYIKLRQHIMLKYL